MIPQLVTRPRDRHRARKHRRACPRGTGTTNRKFGLTRNRPTTVTNPDGSTTGTTYDAATYMYDANGRLTGFVAKKDATVISQGTYTLNPAGQRTNLAYVAPDGNTRNLAWTYDGAGRLTKETRDLPAHTTSWTLDAVGNRTNQTRDVGPMRST